MNVGAVRFTEQYGLDGVVGEEIVVQAQAGIGADLGWTAGPPRINWSGWAAR